MRRILVLTALLLSGCYRNPNYERIGTKAEIPVQVRIPCFESSCGKKP